MTARALDELTQVVLAPNPSPMTLEGTNTYVIGGPGTGEVVVVDPGPDLAEHRAAVDAAIGDRSVAAVVLTHHHVDHAEAAGWAAQWTAEAFAFSPELVSAEVTALRDEEVIARAGISLAALHTPGHASDHLCLRVRESDAVLTGDHVLGRGTTVVAWPDGDMAAYMASLQRLAQTPATVLFPGHGPTIADPAAAVGHYLAHRRERETQVLEALEAGDGTPVQIVARVYADVDVALHPAAERSVRAHLDKLVNERRIVRIVDPSVNKETYRVR